MDNKKECVENQRKGIPVWKASWAQERLQSMTPGELEASLLSYRKLTEMGTIPALFPTILSEL